MGGEMLGPPPMPKFEMALSQAKAFLREPDLHVIEDSGLPNPLQGLWIFSYTCSQGQRLEGGGIVVDADGAREMESTPDAIEYVGVVVPDDEEDEMDAVLEEFGGETLADDIEFDNIISNFGGFNPGQPRAKDGKWNPGGGGGGKKDDKPKSEAERTRNLVKAILATLKDVLNQLSSKQAKALIERIEDNAKAFIQGQSSPANRGGGGKGGGKGGAAEGKDGGKKGGSGPDEGKSGGKSGPPGGLEGVIRGVTNLIESYGNNMKDEDREKLQKAVNELK